MTAVPAAHGVSTVLPVGAKWPTVVFVHSVRLVRLVALEYEPFLHGSAALAPSGQYEPGSQATHACSPSPVWYVPAVHLTHVAMLASGATVPGLHLLGSAAPVPHADPGGHSRQSSGLVIERLSCSIVSFW